MVAQRRAEGEGAKGEQFLARSERSRNDLLPQQRPVGAEEQRPLLRKQLLEEDDNGPMALELLVPGHETAADYEHGPESAERGEPAVQYAMPKKTQACE